MGNMTPGHTRPPRWGQSALYAVRMAEANVLGFGDTHHFHADSVTVTGGVLMLAAELPPYEDDGEDGEGDGDGEMTEAGEYRPVLILAPGEWRACYMVTQDGQHEALFEASVMARITDEG